MTSNCSHYLQVKGKKYTFMLKIMEVRKTLNLEEKRDSET